MDVSVHIHLAFMVMTFVDRDYGYEHSILGLLSIIYMKVNDRVHSECGHPVWLAQLIAETRRTNA